MIDPKDCTIIIPHLGATEEQEYSLDQCLESLKETFDGKIIVAGNGKTDCKHDRNMWIEGQGQCGATNLAAQFSDTPWIFITNDDMIYPPGWWKKLTALERPCISPQLVEPRPGAPTFIVEFFGGAGGDFNKQGWLDYASKHLDTVQFLRPGFNLPFLIKRDLWNMIGGYDINYDPWGSNGDSDIAYKLKLAGTQPMQNTNSIVYHFSQTSGTFEPKNDSYRFANYAYFKEKWGFDRTDVGIWEATFEIPDDRKFRPAYENKYK